ncbi:MAG: hypothetical protein ABI619_01540 [Betaproteobacteria bacterium]
MAEEFRIGAIMTTTDLLREAVSARDRGDLCHAETILQQIQAEHQESSTYFAILGHVKWNLDKLDEAIVAFRRATTLAPTEEIVSIALFHCLWECDDTDAAFTEARRYVTAGGESKAYRQLFSEIRGGRE